MRPRSICSLIASVALVMAACQDVTAPDPATGSAASMAHARADRGDRTECRNMVLTGVYRDIYIPPGFNCWIRGSHVTGHVRGERPMHVEISTSTVDGNVQIEGGGDLNQSVIIDHLTGGGNVHVDRRAGGGIWLGNSQIDGNVKIDGNVVTTFLHVTVSGIAHDLHVFHNRVAAPAYMLITENQVAKNLQVFHNEGNGLKGVLLNRVGQNLLCQGNAPAFVGQPNEARDAHGQCGMEGARR